MTKSTEGSSAIRYDAHCHIISREVFFDKIVILLIDASKGYDFKKLIAKFPANETDQEESDRLRILKLLELLLENQSGKETFNDLRKAYAELDPSIQKFIPLMVDFEYIFRTRYNASEETKKDKARKKDHAADVQEKFDDVRTKIKKVLKKDNSKEDQSKVELLTRFISETEGINKPDKQNRVDTQSIEIIKPYERQLETFKELKEEYKDNFLAFLPVDPRRPDMMDIIAKQVGKDKTFTGVKLYPPMGYSPTDPFLYGKNEGDDCLYKYCMDNQIPIVAHCSSAGFCTFVKRLEVIGAVMPDMEFDSQPVIYTQVTEIKFKTNILNFGMAVQERAYKLNHPKLWEIVLKRFPNLKIDLAHFGGDPDKYGTERREYIYKLMTQKQENGLAQYPYLYTDLSCITEKELIQDIYNNKFNQIHDRLMYGSDYFLNIIWGEDFKTYYQNFTQVFNGNMDTIAVGNVEGFLGGIGNKELQNLNA